ncbi:MAG TPA: hypothetical protein VND93_11540, partial [Myxococcales bacterium]|nr:hypothetical protein [Myxococcales bacterium]
MLRGDVIVAAVQEERLSRRKRHVLRGAAPSLAIRYCLDAAGLAPEGIDLVVFSSPASTAEAANDIRRNPDLRLVERGAPVEIISHHLAHAVSAYALSGFADAAAVVIDGAGSPHPDLSPEERACVVGPVAPGARESISL